MDRSPDAVAAAPQPVASSQPTALLRSPRFRGHDTGAHPENPDRLAAIDAELARAGLLDGRPEVPFAPAAPEAVERVHDPRCLAALHRLAAAGGGSLDPDTIVRADSVEVALLAAGAAVAAIDAVLAGAVGRAFVLARPPGHHATTARGMGFCLINTVAVAAAHALAAGLERVAIVDWDVHHGNGTQDIFAESDRVFFCSVHQSPLYPGTGAAGERGRGRGTGFTLNLPLPAGQGDAVYRRLFAERVLPAVRAFSPELVLVSAGFDGHRADPLAGMELTERGFADLAAGLVDLADETAAGRLVAVLEGGYDPPALAGSVAAVLRVLDGETPASARQAGKGSVADSAAAQGDRVRP